MCPSFSVLYLFCRKVKAPEGFCSSLYTRYHFRCMLLPCTRYLVSILLVSECSAQLCCVSTQRFHKYKQCVSRFRLVSLHTRSSEVRCACMVSISYHLIGIQCLILGSDVGSSLLSHLLDVTCSFKL